MLERIAFLSGGLLFSLAALLCFGIGCSGAGARRNWLGALDHAPGRSAERFGECVAGMDRIFDTSDGPVSFALMVLFLLIAAALVYLGARRPKQAIQPG